MIKYKNASEFSNMLIDAFKEAKSIGLTTHINPDGDGLCTCLALKKVLSGLGLKADLVVDDANLDRFNFLDIGVEITLNNPALEYDLLVIIDLHDSSRLGDREHLAEKAGKIVVIDHHEIENDLIECDFCWIDSSAVCTGWMLYKLFEHLIKAMAEADRIYVGTCLYTTLLNDTNNFTNANTDRHSYELSAALCNLGIKPYQIHRKFMISRTPVEMKLIGEILSTIELMEDGKVLFMHSTIQMLINNNLDAEATSNITRWVQDLKGVETIVYFREEGLDDYRLSLRSKTINVHSIAIQYEGGGHIQASGCHCVGSLKDIKTTILQKLLSAEKLHD